MRGTFHLSINTMVLIDTIKVFNKLHVNNTKIFDIKISNFVYEKLFVSNLNIFLQYGIAIFLFYIGSLIPDIDSERSLLGRYFHLPVEHRGITHTFWFIFPFICFSFFFSPLWLFFVYGFLLHILIDTPSKCGICFFNPWTGYIKYNNGAKIKKNHKIKLYKVHDISEILVFLIIMFILCFIFYII